MNNDKGAVFHTPDGFGPKYEIHFHQSVQMTLKSGSGCFRENSPSRRASLTVIRWVLSRNSTNAAQYEDGLISQHTMASLYNFVPSYVSPSSFFPRLPGATEWLTACLLFVPITQLSELWQQRSCIHKYTPASATSVSVSLLLRIGRGLSCQVGFNNICHFLSQTGCTEEKKMAQDYPGWKLVLLTDWGDYFQDLNDDVFFALELWLRVYSGQSPQNNCCWKWSTGKKEF